MRILTAVTYYRPYTSGLTLYAERLARALVARGHEVTVLAMLHDAALAREETLDGVRVVRARPLAALSKGFVSAELPALSWRLAARHDALILHLPQFDAPLIAACGRAMRLPVIVTCHCEVTLPPGAFNRIAGASLALANRTAARLADRVVAYTEDYADHAPLLRANRRKVTVVPPPVDLPRVAPDDVEAFRRRYDAPGRRPRIAMAARLASEKGVDVLIDALGLLRDRYPDAVVAFAGPHEGVPGEATYAARLAPRLDALRREGRWQFLGTLPQAQMGAFFRTVDVLAVPSVNATESFGLVQIEAMINGTPVVASGLPGVRQPVAMTGMGAVCTPGDAASLADALDRVLSGRWRASMSAAAIRARFDPDRVAAEYETLIGQARRRS
jgi:glycosyltransferase involved in cell wall biosynthesis